MSVGNSKIRVALAGNPNCGKTTMFNSLTGSSQYVGNWPGVTVEKKEGKLKGNKEVIITDLPGVYSLSPYTLEEVVTRNYLIHEKPDVVLNLVDGTNLERNLYLTTQILELGIPVVIALNMMDIVRKSGDKIDIAKLKKELGCEIVETSALKGEGSLEAAEKAVAIARSKAKHGPMSYSADIEAVIHNISEMLRGKVSAESERWHAIKVFERDEKVLEALKLTASEKEKAESYIAAAEDKMDDDSESIITNERYEWIGNVVRKCAVKKKVAMTTSDKIDRIVTNRLFALPIFVAVMFVVYYVSVTSIGTIVTDFTNETLFAEWIQPAVGTALENMGVADWLVGLVVDGIIGGVGAVLGFVPQMMVLFLFLSFLEDCGYMARVAFIMDRIFRRFGLSGKSFIPMLITSGCGVPGIMAVKTIENEKDRRMTAMTTTFIPCGAKMPIIALFIGAMFGTEMGAWVAPMFYFLGVAAVIVSGIMLKKTKMFAGDPAPFVMELPQYHLPTVRGVLMHVWERSRAFIIKAGTIIFIACAIIWFLSNFGFVDGSFTFLDPELMGQSILANIGKTFAWIFAPLGFAYWEAAVATVVGLVAKEAVVSTFGVLFGLGEVDEADPGLWNSFAIMLPAVYQQISFIAFNLLCAPCFAAIGALKREMNSAKWTTFAIAYQCVFAYVVALTINQFGALFMDNSFSAGTVFAIVAFGALLYMLFRPDPNKKRTNLNKTATANLSN